MGVFAGALHAQAAPTTAAPRGVIVARDLSPGAADWLRQPELLGLRLRQLQVGQRLSLGQLLGPGWHELVLQREDLAQGFCTTWLQGPSCSEATLGMKLVPFRRLWVPDAEGTYHTDRVVDVHDVELIALDALGWGYWVALQPESELQRLPDTPEGSPMFVVRPRMP